MSYIQGSYIQGARPVTAGYPTATTSYVQRPASLLGSAGQPMSTVSPAGSTVISGGTVRTMPTTSAGYTTLGGTVSSVQGGTVVRSMASPQVYSSVPTVQSLRSAAGVQLLHYPTVQPGIVQQPRYTIGQYSQAAYETKHQEDPQLKNLKELRKNCGLKYVPVKEGLKGLKAGCVDGKLSREDFIRAYVDLLKTYGIEVPSSDVQNACFDLFDRDDNGFVDMMELICGISLLCQGTEEDKIHAVFDIFDENGDGFISMDEMFKFLTSVFKVVLTPQVMGVMQSMGVEVESAEDLASVTSLECFKAADLNQDGKLSISEFKEWFYAPKNDPSFLFSPMRKLLQ